MPITYAEGDAVTLTALALDTTAAPPAVAVDSDAWRSLFNRAQFHRLNRRPGQQIVGIEVRDDDGRLLGGLAGMRTGDELVSGFSAPFGGLDLVDTHATAETVQAVVDGSVRELESAGVRRITVKLPPASSSANEGLLQFFLLNAGFRVVRTELNQAIRVERWRSVGDYVDELRPVTRKALRRLAAEDLWLREATDVEGVRRGYDLLAANRAAKGRRLALSQDYVVSAWRALAPAVRMFELCHGHIPVAAALVYRVAAGRDLVVAWGDGPHDLPRSPMVTLAHDLVERAVQEGVALLDLAISNEPDEDEDGRLRPNVGLTRFKRSVLATVEPRFTVVREMS
ncbi:GNAT family N-acetyltransferase [Nocardioides sp. CER19]|uniref:GNAT family N-acetyltransferase n=1 Tax=Nocardioides sp. CER19 TaxID=3038538 RepID=UPI00244B3ECB|nr:GNAT family N-acetyltransferase [Nocardioides sp. CER19]MDH2416931.1 GNAT family N-acetyltransferase [Nocardioides sp. CER19]